MGKRPVVGMFGLVWLGLSLSGAAGCNCCSGGRSALGRNGSSQPALAKAGAGATRRPLQPTGWNGQPDRMTAGGGPAAGSSSTPTPGAGALTQTGPDSPPAHTMVPPTPSGTVQPVSGATQQPAPSPGGSGTVPAVDPGASLGAAPPPTTPPSELSMPAPPPPAAHSSLSPTADLAPALTSHPSDGLDVPGSLGAAPPGGGEVLPPPPPPSGFSSQQGELAGSPIPPALPPGTIHTVPGTSAGVSVSEPAAGQEASSMKPAEPYPGSNPTFDTPPPISGDTLPPISGTDN